MSIKTAIQNAKTNTGTMDWVTIKIHGNYFTGNATCAPEDEEFYSPKIGKTLSHKRAMLNAMRHERECAKYRWQVLKKAYADAMQNQEEDDTIFKKSVHMAENRYHKYQRYVRELQQEITDYIQGQAKTFDSIRKQREGKEN